MVPLYMLIRFAPEQDPWGTEEVGSFLFDYDFSIFTVMSLGVK